MLGSSTLKSLQLSETIARARALLTRPALLTHAVMRRIGENPNVSAIMRAAARWLTRKLHARGGPRHLHCALWHRDARFANTAAALNTSEETQGFVVMALMCDAET